MLDSLYCRAGWCRCLKHEVVADPMGESWDRCGVTCSHTNMYERCPVPNKQQAITVGSMKHACNYIFTHVFKIA